MIFTIYSRNRDKNVDRGSFYMLVHSPSIPNRVGWVKAKAGDLQYNPHFSHKWQKSKYLSHYYHLPGSSLAGSWS